MSQCSDMGAKLVEIQTDEEGRFIMDNLPDRIGNEIVYTGRKRNANDVWVFATSEAEINTTVRSWSIGEPSGGELKCGCTSRLDSFVMVDCYCTGFTLFYMCEIVR
ncbi:uncharacterized protein LOC117331517 [Pecten maximus]|uniref:uncharacterized protein LOC117331517 n=1 Tax=Pecten maximus TaxID=6579 RepID=UPI001459042A|nr:uncharacterized protein LOC117331517 [Pecten maximus]